jgi:phosphopantothenoylcysteine decarboxylase/phosphopantothenate--cysteine ligase
MSKNILFKISGSIAAYKSAFLISKLVQEGYQVQCVATPSALKFMGAATLEGLSGRPVLSDIYEHGRMMDHIALNRWADLTILAPATANRINRMAQGLGDDLVGALFLSHDFKKPYLLAPAMNTKMLEHPATQSALGKLIQWGIEIQNPKHGALACGETGSGRMQEPDALFKHITKHFTTSHKTHATPLKVLITGGGTREEIDGVRYLSNLSTGKTAGAIADHLYRQGHHVTYLKGLGAADNTTALQTKTFSSFDSLARLLQKELAIGKYDALVHAAAVSDYSATRLNDGAKDHVLPLNEKLSSQSETITIELKRNAKLINTFHNDVQGKKPQLVGFKFTHTANKKEREEQIKHLFDASRADLVVHNDKENRNADEQTCFEVYCDAYNQLASAKDAPELALVLEQALLSMRQKENTQ